MFQNLRQSNHLANVRIQIGTGKIFPGHRIILESTSVFFQILFSERWNAEETAKDQVRLFNIDDQFVSDEIFEILLDYFYTSTLILTPKNIRGVLEASHYLQIDELYSEASKYLNEMLCRLIEDSSPKKDEQTNTDLQKFNHISLLKSDSKQFNHFGDNLCILKNDIDWLLLVKSRQDDQWLFIDSIEESSEECFDKSDVYVCRNECIILHPTPTRLNCLKVTVGILWYSRVIDDYAYLYASEPINHQRYNFQTGEFSPLQLLSNTSLRSNILRTSTSEAMFVMEQNRLAVFHIEKQSWEDIVIPEKFSKSHCYYRIAYYCDHLYVFIDPITEIGLTDRRCFYYSFKTQTFEGISIVLCRFLEDDSMDS